MTRSVLGIGTLGLLAALAATPALLAQQQGGGQRQGQQGAQQGGQSLIGQNAPNFNLKDIDGKTHSLQDYRGKVLVLEWIDPTNQQWLRKHQQGGDLKECYERYKEQGVTWLGICSFSEQQGQQRAGQQQGQQTRPQQGGAAQTTQRSAVLPFNEQQAIEACKLLVQEHALDFPILLDPNGAVARQFKVEQLPHLAVVDKDGKVTFERRFNDFDRAIERAISGEGTLPASAPRETEQERQMRDRMEEERRRR